MELIEKIFESDVIDKKHKLNVCNKEVSENILNQIESGVNIEFLENLNFPVFSYKTQITIHGLFPVQTYSRICGYKFLFQNKNRSIGIKYNAIDIKKKMLLRKYLSLSGWKVEYNSSVFYYFQNSRYYANKEEAIQNLPYYVNAAAKIKENQHLFNGKISVNVYYILYYGYFISLKLQINSIYKKNLKEFIEKITSNNIRDIAKTLRENRIKKNKEYEQAKNKILYGNAKLEQIKRILIEKTKSIGLYQKNEIDAGTYIKVIADFENIGYKKYIINKVNRHFEYKSTKTYHNIQDCINSNDFNNDYMRKWTPSYINGIKI